MKKHFGLALILLIAATIACGGGDGVAPDVEQPMMEVPAEEATVIQAEEPVFEEPVQEVPAEEATVVQAEEAFELPPFIETDGGFNAPYREVNDLPVLQMPAGGAMPPPCEQSDEMEPYILTQTFENSQFLCVFAFPLEVGSPPLTLTLTDPNGQAYTETFTLEQGTDMIDLINSAGEKAGFVDDFLSSQPVIMVWLDFSADLPGGTWQALGENGEMGTAGSFVIEHLKPFISILDTLATNGPFHNFNAYSTLFDTGDRVQIAGTGYTPDTDFVIAAYIPMPDHDPETGMMTYTAPFAATITTDANGNFLTEFIVGEGTMSGEFIIVIDPFAQDWIDPHYGRFYVRELPGVG